MKLNQLLYLLFIFLSYSSQAQFKRSYNHYYNNTSVYQSIAIEQPNQNIELLRVERNATFDLLITTSRIDQDGELITVNQFPFITPSALNGYPLITGVFDLGTERIVILEFPSTSTMLFYVLKYDKTNGMETSHYLHTDLYKTSFVNSIVNGNEIANYAVKSTGGLYRLTFDMQNINSTTEELVDAAITNIGGAAIPTFGKDGGKAIVFNGNEVSSFISGAKQVYERTSANTYVSHSLNANASGQANLIVLPNGNLFVANNGDLFEINSSFNIVNSNLQESSVGSNNSEFGILNNKLHHFYLDPGQQKVINLIYDLSFNLIDSIAHPNSKPIDLIPFNAGLACINYQLTENQACVQYDGISTNFTSNPIVIDYFTSNANPSLVQEFRHTDNINNLTVDLGLGNQFIPMTNGSFGGAKYNDSLRIVYSMENVYTGLWSNELLGIQGSVYRPQFLPGPFTTSGLYTDLVSDKYNRGFFVSRQMIEDHIDSIQSGSTNYVAPFGIRNWPAHGDVALGQAEILAAFVDINANNIYEPYGGDYPSIYGNYCFFSITHDNPNSLHSASIETHSYKYWFSCDSTSDFQNTIFHKTFHFSRIHDFEEFSLGTIGDIDLGNYNDDYAGTHAELGLMYQYNGDLYDEINSGIPGFNDKCPAAGFMILKGTKLGDDGLDNTDGIAQDESVNGFGFSDSWIDNEYFGLEHSIVFTGLGGAFGQSDPITIQQYTNYLNGLWQYGTQLYYGGNGYPNETGTTTIATHCMYTGDSDTLNWATEGADPGFPWSEFEPTGPGSTSNPPGDRRIIGSTRAQAFYVGDTVVYDIAFVMSNDTNVVTTIGQAQNSLFEKCKVIKADFNQNGGPCGISFDPIEEDLATTENELNTVLVYPNPTNGVFKIDGLTTVNASIAVYDLEGRLLFEQSGINSATEISLDGFKGNLFMVSITDGTYKYVKRIVKN